ncbi:LysR substrate-binding domain-containing protein [Paraburkholderia sp. IW21]|uniref:LysR substrate-binding domain-containing protein n=1 Tax=Paraburkholderia sp. IW21 TaxID=3242488 RepID=UPI003520F38A
MTSAIHPANGVGTIATGHFDPTRLKTRQLALIVQLDTHRSVLRAADAAHMTQPGATKLLRELEETMGVPLFERHPRGVEPTWYGEVLIRHARSVLAELQHAYDEVSALKAGLTGQAMIGTEVTAATNLVPQAVALLKKRFPQIRVNIEMEFSEVLVQRLQEGKLDMIVARIRNPDDLAELHYAPLAEAQHALFARVGHPLVKRKTLSWNELAPQTWILPPKGNVMRNQFTQLFLERQLALPTDVVESSSLPVISSLLQMSDMIAPLAREPVRPYCIAGALEPLPFELDLKLGPAGMVTRRGDRLSPGARAMLQALREAAGFDTQGPDADSD